MRFGLGIINPSVKQTAQHRRLSMMFEQKGPE
jgi:hypothetical protein